VLRIRTASSAFLLAFSIILLTGCSTIIKVGHPLRKGFEYYPIGGSRRVEFPVRGGEGTYHIVVDHFDREEGNFYVYSSRFYEERGILPVHGRALAILKFVDEDGSSKYTLVYAWWRNARVELSVPEAFEIRIDGSLYKLEYDFYSIGEFVSSCPLSSEITGKLRNAATITIWEITLEEQQRLLLQSFLFDTENVTYSTALDGS
jgi:hypothetical protein